MTTIPYKSPSYDANAFNCPYCNAYAKQEWGTIRYIGKSNFLKIENADIGICDHCNNYTIWIETKMVFPLTSTAPFPNSDLPDDIKQDYEEARQIQTFSPRGSAALLRLCIQKLCIKLGEKGKNINDDIASLVSKGLSPQVQQALDIVRVVGNEAVHPGQIDLNDNTEIANNLFGLVNIICDVMITQPKHIEEMYNNVVPESKKEAIKKRDNNHVE
jgi:Domain of unknown function (DUF4145)